MENITSFRFDFNLGRLERQTDPRDYPAQILLGKGAPAPLTLAPADAAGLPITMQGTEGSCGGFSIQYAFVLTLYRAAVASGMTPAEAQYLALSPRSAYAIEKFIDGTGINTVGTTIQAVAKAFQTWGIALESLFPSTDTTLPNNVYGDYNQMSAAAKADAATRAQAGFSYFFVGKAPTLQNLKDWIAEYGFVLLEVEVGDEWYTSPAGVTSWANADVNPLRPPKTVISGHFILATTFDEATISGPNSWSEQWGDKGWFHMQANYMPFVTNGLVFQKIPPSVKQALTVPASQQLTTDQVSVAERILDDLSQLLGIMEGEVGGFAAKLGGFAAKVAGL